MTLSRTPPWTAGATELQPADADELIRRGDLARHQDRLAEAAAAYRAAITLRPDDVPACHNLAIVLHRMGRLAEARDYYERALLLRPDLIEAHCNLGVLELQAKRPEVALAHLQLARSRRPDLPQVALNLGNVLLRIGRVDDAIAAYRAAIDLHPADADACHNLASAMKAAGRLDDALTYYDRALALEPSHVLAHSARLYALHFHPGYDAQTILQEHRRWNDRLARPLAARAAPHDNDPTPGRRLRVGYVSPHLCDHVVALYMLPLLANHDHGAIEVMVFSDVACPDAMTDRLRAHADLWVSTAGMSDEQLARLIREHRVDILVDLTMHMEGSHLLAFARRPAPVQVTYLAYPGTTGLAVMDYRLTDPYLDPPGIGDESYVELSIRLPETFWCYRPPPEAPAVASLPALATGNVTFGCLNNFCKVTPAALDTWSEVLRTVSRSRLVLQAFEGQPRQGVRDRMAAGGVDPERLEFVGFLPRREYFGKYHHIDVALDPFPYAGATTTCDALWMGVPVVSLAGETAVARAGLSLLSNIGLPELVATTRTQYVRIALALATDLERLAGLRASLRERMTGSPLTNAPRFARGIEAAYRSMWHHWCDARASASTPPSASP